MCSGTCQPTIFNTFTIAKTISAKFGADTDLNVYKITGFLDNGYVPEAGIIKNINYCLSNMVETNGKPAYTIRIYNASIQDNLSTTCLKKALLFESDFNEQTINHVSNWKIPFILPENRKYLSYQIVWNEQVINEATGYINVTGIVANKPKQGCGCTQ